MSGYSLHKMTIWSSLSLYSEDYLQIYYHVLLDEPPTARNNNNQVIE